MVEIRRLRPWLGTFVEIHAAGPDQDVVNSAVESAYAAIARVQRLMSFHEPDSDVSRLNRAATQAPVAVDPWTLEVFWAALRLSECSNGLFDCTVADRLIATGFLPAVEGHGTDPHQGTWRDIDVRKDGRIFFHKPLVVDFGGIAKGFAVDLAVAALVRGGAHHGIVNAGGDLRVFGGVEHLIRLRNPRSPMQAATTMTVRDGAMATSAPYFSRRRHAGGSVSPLINPRTGQSCTQAISVTVQAPDCLHADALTKVVLADPVAAASVLSAYGASATVIGDRRSDDGFVGSTAGATRPGLFCAPPSVITAHDHSCR